MPILHTESLNEKFVAGDTDPPLRTIVVDFHVLYSLDNLL